MHGGPFSYPLRKALCRAPFTSFRKRPQNYLQPEEFSCASPLTFLRKTFTDIPQRSGEHCPGATDTVRHWARHTQREHSSRSLHFTSPAKDVHKNTLKKTANKRTGLQQFTEHISNMLVLLIFKRCTTHEMFE